MLSSYIGRGLSNLESIGLSQFDIWKSLKVFDMEVFLCGRIVRTYSDCESPFHCGLGIWLRTLTISLISCRTCLWTLFVWYGLAPVG